jgi:hypothetical protein
MPDTVFNKKNLIIFLIIILVIIVLMWLFMAFAMSRQSESANNMEVYDNSEFDDSELDNSEFEGFNSYTSSDLNEPKDTMPSPPEDKNKAYVEPKTGILLDGPGFEKGEFEGVPQETLSAIPSNYYFLDDGAGGEMSIQHNLCSKSCCSEQWPTPFKQKYDPYVCGNKDEFVPSQTFCNNSFQDSGCLCLTKKQAQFLYNRGSNGRSWF